MDVRRQFVRVGERTVLVRYAGRGPAVVLLHQSPQNSRALIPIIERLAQQFAVFAPDTPGFGESDPLAIFQPEIPDYSRAVADLLDSLKLDSVMVYGVHTGAVTALRLALDFPERVSALVCDGYARFNAAERETLLANYLPPFEPTWDGAHLVWLYARLREQHLFFPWHVGTAAARLNYPVPLCSHIHNDVMQVLDAGDGYRIGYRAPFMYDDETAAGRLTVPTKLFYREEDVLVSHLERLPVVAADVSIELVTGGPDALAAKTEAFFEFRGKGIIAVDAIQKASSARAPNRSILSTDWGELGYRVVSGNGRNAVVCLHDIGTPAIVPVKYDRSRVTLIPDLPGHGTSRDWPIENCSPEHIASALLTLIDNLELEELSIVAIGGSCAIGVRLAQKLGRRLSRISLSNPMPLDSIEQSQFMALLPDTTPTDTGAHLLAAWNYARMRYLFCPWQLQNGDAAQKVNAPAPRRVHRDMIEILRAGKRLHTLWQKCFGVNLSAELSKLDIPMELNVIDNNEHVKVATRLVHALGLRPNKNSERGTQSWQK